MNVLLINGSPHKEGCTFTALSEVAEALNRRSIATEIFHIGTRPMCRNETVHLPRCGE